MINSITYLYPNAIVNDDFKLQDDGQGAYISYWNIDKLGTQPTDITLSNAEIEATLAITKANQLAQFTSLAQGYLDNFAKSAVYDSILSACTYATSTVPKFAKEGQYCVTARDTTWSKAYDVLTQVQAGTITVPTEAEFIAMLPVLVMPV